MFLRLPVLEAMLDRVGERYVPSLTDTVLVCSQHLLESTGSLVECFLRCGVQPDHIFLMGKHYSSNDEVVTELRSLGPTVFSGSKPQSPGSHESAIRADAHGLWEAVFERFAQSVPRHIIIIDDGAHCVRTIPELFRHSSRIVAIEQTTSGITEYRFDPLPFPVIAVASSAAKRYIEPALICDAVLRRTSELIPVPLTELRLGILGLGNIGKALANSILASGQAIFGFDVNHSRMRVLPPGSRLHSAEDVFLASDLIFGCTGAECIQFSEVKDRLKGEKILASCSSGDVEFRSLYIDGNFHQIGDGACPALVVEPPNKRFTIRALRGGFPVNFDNSRESVPSNQIQLTRALLFGGVLQAAELISNEHFVKKDELMLSPAVQSFCVQNWQLHTDLVEPAQATNYADLQWVSSHSGGTHPERSVTNSLNELFKAD